MAAGGLAVVPGSPVTGSGVGVLTGSPPSGLMGRSSGPSLTSGDSSTREDDSEEEDLELFDAE